MQSYRHLKEHNYFYEMFTFLASCEETRGISVTAETDAAALVPILVVESRPSFTLMLLPQHLAPPSIVLTHVEALT